MDHPRILERIKLFQRGVRDRIIQTRGSADSLYTIGRTLVADTIYAIDIYVEPQLEAFCQQWAAEEGPLVLVAEGLEDQDGNEVESRVFPAGASEGDASMRLIVDPIDGTRGIMYDKRSAWTLAGVVPNRGRVTRLRDIELAVMTELPTSKMGRADVLWAVKGRGALAERVDLRTGAASSLPLQPSTSPRLDHGFASISNFFPGTKVLASQLMESITSALNERPDSKRAIVFDDQYICTGGQFYELIVGHDRFNADLRPVFYQMQNQPSGLCCHPYDCAAWLIAEQAGVILTDACGAPLDGPLDTTTPISWIGYANAQLRSKIEPLIHEFLSDARFGGTSSAS